jgi:ankyrin repeat protein
VYGTPLHAATAKGYFDVVQVLLQHGADTTAWDRYHRTPSQVAVANGQYVIAQLLDQHRAT